ncbi:hypothetical protein COOONC_20886, partial [Cooperia oncophora]
LQLESKGSPNHYCLLLACFLYFQTVFCCLKIKFQQRSTDVCETKCFKWQQILNNSGSFSKMTFRGCYDKMFDLMNPTTQAIPDHNFCTCGFFIWRGSTDVPV